MQKELRKNIKYYMRNTNNIKKCLEKIGLKVFGGTNAPYVWIELPQGEEAWSFFDKLLNETGIVGTPGDGFGPGGKGYFRLSGFGNKDDTNEAIKRIQKNIRKVIKQS